jgi:putative membrane protein
MTETVMETKAKTLILCIDQDNDIGKKAEVDTPVVGVEANKEAAATLAIADPEEADSNAMFGAIKLYKELTKKYQDEDFQVATIAGASSGGIEADRKMIEELQSVLAGFPASEIVLVTDGFADDVLKPIMQSRVPITSVHHVVVKHSERIEETYAVFGKYLKMIFDDPYYSRFALGVPGVLLLIFGFLIASNQLQNAGLAVVFVLGIVFFIKGFGIYDKVTNIKPRLPPPEEQLVFVARLIGLMVAVVGIYQGASSAAVTLPSPIRPLWDLTWWAGVLPTFISVFLLKGIDLIIVSVMVILIGGAVMHYLRKDERLGQSLVSINLTFWVRFIVVESAKIFQNPETPISIASPLIFYTVASVATTIIAVFLTYRKYKRLPFT